MGPASREESLLDALRSVDGAPDEHVVSTGAMLVWGFRGRTRHPKLAEAFPDGLLLITARSLPDEACSTEEEVGNCRVSLPAPAAELCERRGPAQPPAPQGTEGRASPLAPGRFHFAILEERLEPLDLCAGRRVLSKLSQWQLRLSLPLLVAVREPAAEVEGCATAGALGPGVLGPERHSRRAISYLGVRTRAAGNDENELPSQARGPHILETIQALRPALPACATIGDTLQGCRSTSRCAEASVRVRHDLRVATEPAGAWTSNLPVDLLPGPFISLVLFWPLPIQQAAVAPLLPAPPPLSCSAMVYVRGSHTPEKSLLGRHLMDLDVLRHLLHPGARLGAVQDPGGVGVLSSEGAIAEAVATLIAKEGRLATSSVALRRRSGVAAAASMAETQPTLRDAEDEDRPGRDFVDRFWLDVVVRCASVPCMVQAVQALLGELGRPDGIVPCVRKDNGTEMAGLVRAAVRMSKLRRYAAPSEAEQLRAAAAAWEEQRRHLSGAEAVAPLVLGMGVECLRRDFLHIVGHRGYVQDRDLGFFLDAAAPPAAQLDRLRGLHHVAELALLCTRHRVCLDTMRQLILRAAAHYQEPHAAASANVPSFAAPLKSSMSGKLLSTFPSADPSSFSVECGESLVHAERELAREDDAGVEGLDAHGRPPPRVGVWRPPPSSESPYEYHVMLFDRFAYAK